MTPQKRVVSKRSCFGAQVQRRANVASPLMIFIISRAREQACAIPKTLRNKGHPKPSLWWVCYHSPHFNGLQKYILSVPQDLTFSYLSLWVFLLALSRLQQTRVFHFGLPFITISLDVTGSDRWICIHIKQDQMYLWNQFLGDLCKCSPASGFFIEVNETLENYVSAHLLECEVQEGEQESNDSRSNCV